MEKSPLLPTNEFDLTLRDLVGLPNGAHTQPTVIQSQDDYGNVSSYMLQTVKSDAGVHAFITHVNASGSARYILPPRVINTLLRQVDACSTMVRRRHGKRLAEERKANGTLPTFTPEMRAKALATRKRNAAKRNK
jgi:hypothetical protein